MYDLTDVTIYAKLYIQLMYCFYLLITSVKLWLKTYQFVKIDIALCQSANSQEATSGGIVPGLLVSVSDLTIPIQSARIMETLEFVIYPDGRVQEKVTGIVGASCAEVTAAIEAQLGVVLHQESTSEYFTQALHQSAEATAQVAFSDW